MKVLFSLLKSNSSQVQIVFIPPKPCKGFGHLAFLIIQEEMTLYPCVLC